MAKRRRKEQPAQTPKPNKPLTQALRQRIEAWAEEAAQAHGVQIFDVETSSNWRVQVTLFRTDGFKPGHGVSIDDCTVVSRYMEAFLDTDPDVWEGYTLEVSSPGLDRDLRKVSHFSKVIGNPIRIVLKTPIEGLNVFEGVLKESDDSTLTLEVNGELCSFSHSELARARLYVPIAGEVFE